MNGIPPESTGFWTRNPPEEWDSAGITGSWTWIQTGKIKNLPISNKTFPGTLTLMDLYRERIIF
jgi:hypothetical protein